MLPDFLTHLVLDPQCTVFTHTGTGSRQSQALWWPPLDNTELRSVVVFVPGNPGVAEFYLPFLSHLHASLPHIAILARSHLNHSTKIAPSTPTPRLCDQVDATLESIDSIVKQYGTAVKIILIGHSVGAWISLQVLKERSSQISQTILLFPTICHIAESPNGLRLSWLFRRPIPNILSVLSPIVGYLPSFVLRGLFSTWPSAQLRVLADFVSSPHATLASLTMARDEMNQIRDPDLHLLRKERHKLCIYFGEEDDWVGTTQECYLSEGEWHDVSHGAGIPHAFCINHGHSQIVADQCTQWLKRELLYNA